MSIHPNELLKAVRKIEGFDKRITKMEDEIFAINERVTRLYELHKLDRDEFQKLLETARKSKKITVATTQDVNENDGFAND